MRIMPQILLVLLLFAAGSPDLLVAIRNGNQAQVQKLLATRGAEPEDRLMLLAAQNGDYDAIQFLLGLGIPAGDATGTTVSAAITARCEACARLLVEKGATVSGPRANGSGVLNDTAK